MSKKAIILAGFLFGLLVLGMFIYAHIKSNELDNSEVEVKVEIEAEIPYPDITSVDAKHYFIEGLHTLVGEINFPTPCDLLQTDTTIMESYPEQVLVKFTVINNSTNCEPIITAQRFKVEFTATSTATLKAEFMGREIRLNLIPATIGERPEEFELFLKG